MSSIVFVACEVRETDAQIERIVLCASCDLDLDFSVEEMWHMFSCSGYESCVLVPMVCM